MSIWPTCLQLYPYISPEIHVNTALDKLQNSIEPTTIYWDVIFKNYYSNANKCLFRLHYFTFLTFF